MATIKERATAFAIGYAGATHLKHGYVRGAKEQQMVDFDIALITSHVARRTFITNNVLILGHSVVDVQHAVGHAQSSTTDKYICQL